MYIVEVIPLDQHCVYDSVFRLAGICHEWLHPGAWYTEGHDPSCVVGRLSNPGAS